MGVRHLALLCSAWRSAWCSYGSLNEDLVLPGEFPSFLVDSRGMKDTEHCTKGERRCVWFFYTRTIVAINLKKEVSLSMLRSLVLGWLG